MNNDKVDLKYRDKDKIQNNMIKEAVAENKISDQDI